jgi:hypothetical protein
VESSWVYSARQLLIGLLYLPRVIMMMESSWWNEDWQGKPKFSEKTCPSATLSTTNPTLPDPGILPGPHRWEASDYPLELWRGLTRAYIVIGCLTVRLACK